MLRVILFRYSINFNLGQIWYWGNYINVNIIWWKKTAFQIAVALIFDLSALHKFIFFIFRFHLTLHITIFVQNCQIRLRIANLWPYKWCYHMLQTTSCAMSLGVVNWLKNMYGPQFWLRIPSSFVLGFLFCHMVKSNLGYCWCWKKPNFQIRASGLLFMFAFVWSHIFAHFQALSIRSGGASLIHIILYVDLFILNMILSHLNLTKKRIFQLKSHNNIYVAFCKIMAILWQKKAPKSVLCPTLRLRQIYSIFYVMQRNNMNKKQLQKTKRLLHRL